VIIFGSVRFLLKKITKPIFFFKKPETGSNRLVSGRFGFLDKTGSNWFGSFFWFDSVFPVWVRFVFSVLGL
jgi:hypothetical protein